MIDVLAIAEAGAHPEPPVVAIPSDGVSVLCAPATDTAADAEALWKREELLERLMERRALLPVRYGTKVADEAAAAAAVAGRGDELRERLDHVRGAIELSVRVRLAEPEPEIEEPPGGAEYLRARTARSHAADAVGAALAALARDSRERAGQDLLRAAYLVATDAVDGFAARVRELQAEHPELAILCTGPWPPYSFTEASS